MTANETCVDIVPLARLSYGSHHLDGKALAWQSAGAAEFWVKPLLRDSASGDRT